MAEVDEKIEAIKRQLASLESTGDDRCDIRYKPTKEILAAVDARMKEMNTDVAALPRDDFLRVMGIEDPATVTAKPGSIVWCINEKIRKSAEMNAFGLEVGVKEKGVKFKFYRKGASIPPETE